MRKILAGLFVAALAAASPAAAEPLFLGSTTTRSPNFLGVTGALVIPSAHTIGERHVAAHLHGSSHLSSFGILGGLGDRFEVGLSILDPDDDFVDSGNELIVNGKFQLLRETSGMPAISVGVVDAFDALDIDPSWYVVASKEFGNLSEGKFGLTGHLGFGGGIYDEEIFAGVEVGLSQNITALADYANDDINIGLRGRYRGWTATIGLFDLDEFGAGISYTARFR